MSAFVMKEDEAVIPQQTPQREQRDREVYVLRA
jgi:hypothetical protein